MPIIDDSICRICKKHVYARKEEIAVFPSFEDPKFRIFNGILHRRCFVEHPLSRELRAEFERLLDPSQPYYQQLDFLNYLNELLADNSTPSESLDEQTDDGPSE